MTHYIVTFDLLEPPGGQAPVRRQLQTYRVHWAIQDSVWIVVSDKPAAQIRDELAIDCGPGGELYVERLHGEAVWPGYPMDMSAMLH